MLEYHSMSRIHEEAVSDVQEPILSEKRSCLRGGCFSSCGCLVMLGVLMLLILRVAWGPRTISLSHVPDHFPEAISVFEPDSIRSIKITRAVNANRTLATATALPRLIYNPIEKVISLHKSSSPTLIDQFVVAGGEIREIFLTPGNEDSSDRIILSWGPLPEDIEDVRDFYVRSFEDSGVRLSTRFDNANNFEAEFKRGDISGTLLIENYDLRRKGVESMKLTVTVPHSF